MKRTASSGLSKTGAFVTQRWCDDLPAGGSGCGHRAVTVPLALGMQGATHVRDRSQTARRVQREVRG